MKGVGVYLGGTARSSKGKTIEQHKIWKTIVIVLPISSRIRVILNKLGVAQKAGITVLRGVAQKAGK